METMQILAQALVDIKRVYESTAGNDAAFRKQCRIILNAPALNYSIARAGDAPAEQAETPKPAKKRTTKPKQTPVHEKTACTAHARRFFHAQIRPLMRYSANAVGTTS